MPVHQSPSPLSLVRLALDKEQTGEIINSVKGEKMRLSLTVHNTVFTAVCINI